MPTEPGYYWCTHIVSGRREIVLAHFGSGLIAVSRPGLRGVYWPEHFTAWCGPIIESRPINTTHCNN